MITEKFEALESVMQNLGESTLLSIINTYSDLNSTGDNLYPMCDFDEMNAGKTPLEVLQSVDSEDFNVEDDYFYVAGTGLYCSTNNVLRYVEETFDISDICESLEKEWFRYAQNFSRSETHYFTNDICNEFCEWAEKQTDGEWVEVYADGEDCIEKDWDKYLEELKQEHEQDGQDE